VICSVSDSVNVSVNVPMKIPIKTILCCVLFISLLIQCTSKKKKPSLTIKEYKKQSVLLVGSVSKLMSESSIERMHNMTVALQQSRAITCFEVDEECKIYGKIISKMIKFSKDKKLSPQERIELQADFKKMVMALKKSISILEGQWAKYSKEK
jgi:hypothetical protein